MNSFFSVCQDGDGHPVEVKVKSKGDGLYSCSYTPTSPLKHTLAVAWGGVGIPKSPFRVSSQSLHPVTAGNVSLLKPEDPVKRVSANIIQSDALVKAEYVKVVQTESTVPEGEFEKVQPKYTNLSGKTKKPIIIITTSVEERYNS